MDIIHDKFVSYFVTQPASQKMDFRPRHYTKAATTVRYLGFGMNRW